MRSNVKEVPLNLEDKDWAEIPDPILIEGYIHEGEHISDEYYPIKDGKFSRYITTQYLKKRGYFYSLNYESWWKLEEDGKYYPSSESFLLCEIQHLMEVKTGSSEISVGETKNVISITKGLSNENTLADEFSEYKASHPDIAGMYDVETIPVFNGLVVLKDHKLLPHCGYLFTPNIFNIYYRPREVITIDEFGREVIKANPDSELYQSIIPDDMTLKCYLKWCSSILFSERPLPIIMCFFGKGGTGKSSCALGLEELLGGQLFANSPFELLMSAHGMTTLEGKLLNVIDESESMSGTRNIGAVIKRITGGLKIMSNPKYKDARMVDNITRFLIIGNSLPNLDVSDSGLIRRLWTIKFSQEQSPTSNLHMKIRDHRAVNWLFNCMLYYKDAAMFDDINDWPSLEMREHKKEYLNTDAFNNFISDFCGSFDEKVVQTKLMTISVAEAYETYLLVVSDVGGKAMSKKEFSSLLGVRYNLKSQPVGNTRYYRVSN